MPIASRPAPLTAPRSRFRSPVARLEGTKSGNGPYIANAPWTAPRASSPPCTASPPLTGPAAHRERPVGRGMDPPARPRVFAHQRVFPHQRVPHTWRTGRDHGPLARKDETVWALGALRRARSCWQRWGASGGGPRGGLQRLPRRDHGKRRGVPAAGGPGRQCRARAASRSTRHLLVDLDAFVAPTPASPAADLSPDGRYAACASLARAGKRPRERRLAGAGCVAGT